MSSSYFWACRRILPHLGHMLEYRRITCRVASVWQCNRDEPDVHLVLFWFVRVAEVALNNSSTFPWPLAGIADKILSVSGCILNTPKDWRRKLGRGGGASPCTVSPTVERSVGKTRNSAHALHQMRRGTRWKRRVEPTSAGNDRMFRSGMAPLNLFRIGCY